MTTEYTKTFRLQKPDFRTSPWSAQLNDNSDRLDAIIYNALLAHGVTDFVNSAAVAPGATMYDPDLNTFFVNTTQHTTITVGTFAQERAANPYWEVLNYAWKPRGTFQNNTQYDFYDVAFDPSVGIAAVCMDPHVSISVGSIADEIAKWEVVFNMAGSSVAASDVIYNNSGTSLSATNAQAALTELDNDFTTEIGTIDGQIVTLQSDMTTAQTDINTLQSDMTTAQGDITAAEGNITTLQGRNYYNYVVNAAMQISQENGTTAGTTSLYYPADEWTISSTVGGTFSFANVSSPTPGGSSQRLRLTVTAADTSIGATEIAVIMHKIEGYRAAPLRSGSASAKTVTVRFGVKAPAGTYSVNLRNSALNRSYAAEYVIAPGEANTDVVKTVTIALDQSGTWLIDNSVGIHLEFCVACGSTYQTAPGAWVNGNYMASTNQFNLFGTNGNVFELFDVGLYEGTTAPKFIVPDSALELIKCKRYYYRISGIASMPYASGVIYSSALAIFSIVFPVVMRAAPTMQFTTLLVLAGSGSYAVSAGVLSGATAYSVRFDATIAGATAGHGAVLESNTGGGVIAFTARL